MKHSEFERNRQEILKNAQLNRSKKSDTGERVWAYEIEKYRRQRKRERFYFIGGLSGIISLILTIALHYQALVALVQNLITR